MVDINGCINDAPETSQSQTEANRGKCVSCIMHITSSSLKKFAY